MSARILLLLVAALFSGCASHSVPPVAKPDGSAFVVQESALPPVASLDSGASTLDGTHAFSRRVLFAPGSALLDARARKILRGVGGMMLLEPRLRIHAIGLASPLERRARIVSERRARSIAQFLRDDGIPADRISISWRVEDVAGCGRIPSKFRASCESALRAALLANQE